MGYCSSAFIVVFQHVFVGLIGDCCKYFYGKQERQGKGKGVSALVLVYLLSTLASCLVKGVSLPISITYISFCFSNLCHLTSNSFKPL